MTHEEIESTILRIEHILIVRWWIFIALCVAMIIGAIGAFANLRSVARIEKLVLQADGRSLSNEAAIEAAFKQQVIYQQQVAQSIDFLAKKNPKITVPRAIVGPPRPSVTPDEQGSKPLTDADLTRPSSPHPTAKPKTEMKHKHSKKKKRPSPTPGPFLRLFKPKSTR